MIEAPLQLAALEFCHLAARTLRRVVRAGKSLFRDDRTPRWLRPMIVFACLPIPGPVDEIVGVIVLALLIVRHRPLLHDAWEASR